MASLLLLALGVQEEGTRKSAFEFIPDRPFKGKGAYDVLWGGG